MIIDLIFIILICMFAICGYKKGMLFSLFSLFAVTCTILLVYIFVPIVIELLSRVINFEKLGELLTRIGINGNNTVNKLYKLTVFLLHFDIKNSAVISVYLLTTMICYIVLYILIKPKVKVLYKSIYNKTKNKLEYNRLDNLFGVFMGLVRGYVFIFFIAVYLNILSDMSIFADSTKVQLASSSYIQFFNDIFVKIFNI